VEDQNNGRLNWGWLISCCLAGAFLIGLALALQTVWLWAGIVPDALVEMGVATTFVGLAFLFERRFVRGITRAATVAAEESFARQTQQMQTRIDELTATVQSRLGQDADAQDEIVAQLDYPSHGRIMKALEEAANLHALPRGLVRVNAGTELGFLTLSFTRHWERGGYVLEVILRPEPRSKKQFSTMPTLRWQDSESAADVGHRIAVEIQRMGFLDDLRVFDWSEALSNLKKSIHVAIRSQRRDPGAWLLKGSLFELIEDDWAVTSAGLEHRPPPDLLIPAKEFFQHHIPGRDTRSEDDVMESLRARRPDWCDPDRWGWLLWSAHSYY